MKRSIKASIATLIIGLIACGAASSVNATPIAPGTTVVPNVTTYPPPGTLVTSMSQNFNEAGVFSGTLNSYVYSGGLLGGYTFVYQIHLVSGPDSIEHLSMGQYGGFSVDVSQALFGGLDQFVTNANRSGGTGSVLSWNFTATLDPGENSYYLIAATNAAFYQQRNVGIIDSETVNVSSFVPDIPDGGSAVALLGIALAGIEGVRRMFRARKT